MQATPQVLQAIETAIQIETDGLTFYTEMAERFQDPRTKRMLQMLAKEETAHRNLFQHARQALLEQDQWPSPQEVKAISPGEIARPAIFPTKEELETAPLSEHARAVLERAIQSEERAIAFYSEQRDRTDDASAQTMYAYLIEQEKVHRAALLAEYGYLTRNNS